LQHLQKDACSWQQATVHSLAWWLVLLSRGLAIDHHTLTVEHDRQNHRAEARLPPAAPAASWAARRLCCTIRKEVAHTAHHALRCAASLLQASLASAAAAAAAEAT
jgi:hypothetical protein